MATEIVWAEVAPGRLRRMTRQAAKEAGYRIDTRRPRGMGRGTFTKRLHLSAEEAEKFFLQTGERVRDENDVQAYYRRSGKHEMERGESQDIARRQLQEYVASGARGESPVEFQGWGRKPVDIHRLYDKIRSGQ